MGLSVHYDKETQKMYVRTEEKLLAVLDAKEAVNFKKEYEQALNLLEGEHAVEKDDYAQIIMDDFEDWLEEGEEAVADDERPWYEGMTLESNIIGINIEVRQETCYIGESITLLKEDGDEESLDIPDSLSRNFSEQQVAFGQASSRQIRRCFDEDVLAYFEKHPAFIVKFCDVEVPRKYLLSDDEEMFFDFETSSDR